MNGNVRVSFFDCSGRPWAPAIGISSGLNIDNNIWNYFATTKQSICHIPLFLFRICLIFPVLGPNKMRFSIGRGVSLTGQEPHWQPRSTSSRTSLRIKNLIKNLIKYQGLGQDLIEILIEIFIINEDFFSLRISMRISYAVRLDQDFDFWWGSWWGSWFLYYFICKSFVSSFNVPAKLYYCRIRQAFSNNRLF